MARRRGVWLDYAAARRFLAFLDAARPGPWDERSWADALFAGIARQLPQGEWPAHPAALRARVRAVAGAGAEPEDRVLAVEPTRR